MLNYIREKAENPNLLDSFEKLYGREAVLENCALVCSTSGGFELVVNKLDWEHRRREARLGEALQLGLLANQLVSEGHFNFGRVYGADRGELLIEAERTPMQKSITPRALMSDCLQFALALAIANQHHAGFCIDPREITREHFCKRTSLRYQSKSGNVYYAEVDNALFYNRYYQGSPLECLREFCAHYGFQEARQYLQCEVTLQEFVNYLLVLDLQCKFFIIEKTPTCQLALPPCAVEVTCAPCHSDFFTCYLTSGGGNLPADFDYSSSLKSFQDDLTRTVFELEELVKKLRPVQLTGRNYKSSLSEFQHFHERYKKMEAGLRRLNTGLDVCAWLLKLTVNALFEKRVRALRLNLAKNAKHFGLHLKAASHCVVASLDYLQDVEVATKKVEVVHEPPHGKKEEILALHHVGARKAKLNK